MTPIHYRQLVAQLQKDNRECNTKTSKLLLIVDGLIDALNSASSCISDHDHNDSALRSERFHIDSVVEDTYERLTALNH